MNGFVKLDSETGERVIVTRAVSNRETIRLRFAHGAAFRLKSDSLPDYLLAPLFLKFIAISVAIIVLLHERPGAGPSVGASYVFSWVSITAGTLLSFFALGAVSVSLKNLGFIRTIYTPLITLPSVLLAEYLAQTALAVLWGWPAIGLDALIVHLSKICAAVLLLDVLYGSFVAPSHPQTVTPVPQPAPEDAPQAARSIDAPLAADLAAPQADGPVPPRPQMKIRVTENIRPVTPMKPSIQLGADRVPMDAIRSITVEDHYLRIATVQNVLLIRGKLASVVEQLGPEVGLQVNRSVWLARAHVSHAERGRDTGMVVILQDGTAVAVSRARVPVLKDSFRRWNIALKSID